MMTGKEYFDSVVAQSKANYYQYSTATKEVEGEQVEFHYVGRNASHEFAIGLTADGRLVTYSAGEGWCGCEDFCDCIPPLAESIRVRGAIVTSEPYIGHW